jgi:plastocyanin
LVRAVVVALLGLLLFAVPASAEVKTLTYRVGPITVAPYQVRQNGLTFGIPKPDVDGAIVAMKTNVVDAGGKAVPIKRLMLHHIVFANVGTTIGAKHDATCDAITGLDSTSRFPALAERFYAAGEERAQMRLPSGYGYHVNGGDTWSLSWMVMNHRNRTDSAYIEYTITYDTDPALTPVRPVWLDVRNCRADPVYDVAGGGGVGGMASRDTQSSDWTPSEAGRVVAGGGHLHGGGERLDLVQPACGDRVLASSRPTWGAPTHPFYNVRPVLHEPGPVHMTGFSTATGFSFGAGQPLRLSSTYDATRPHTRVMGIMMVYVAPPAPGADPCGPLPSDVQTDAGPAGRSSPPKVVVPLTGLDRRGRARTIAKPPGRLRRAHGNASVAIRRFAFSVRNLSVPKGATVRWSFRDDDLHDVTLASGPRGFSSPHHNRGASYEQTLTVPGTYRLFCSLHPVAMTERIVVRR